MVREWPRTIWSPISLPWLSAQGCYVLRFDDFSCEISKVCIYLWSLWVRVRFSRRNFQKNSNHWDTPLIRHMKKEFSLVLLSKELKCCDMRKLPNAIPKVFQGQSGWSGLRKSWTWHQTGLEQNNNPEQIVKTAAGLVKELPHECLRLAHSKSNQLLGRPFTEILSNLRGIQTFWWKVKILSFHTQEDLR